MLISFNTSSPSYCQAEESKTRNVIHFFNTCTSHYDNRKGSLTIKVVLKGEATYYFEQRKVRVHQGSFLLLHPGTAHRLEIDALYATQLIEIYFSQNMFQKLQRFKPGRDKLAMTDLQNPTALLQQQTYVISPSLRHLLRSLPIKAGEVNRCAFEDEQIIHRVLFCLHQFYGNSHQQLNSLKVRKHSTKMELYQRLHLAKDFILSNYENNITLKDIGRASNIAPSHLLRHFPSFFNATPHQMIIQLRINMAKALLQHTDFAVTEIIHRIGFKNDSSFIRLFKGTEGVTPVIYRLQYQKERFCLTA